MKTVCLSLQSLDSPSLPLFAERSSELAVQPPRRGRRGEGKAGEGAATEGWGQIGRL